MGFKRAGWKQSPKAIKRETLDRPGAMEALFARYGTTPPASFDWHPVHCLSPDHFDENASASVNMAEGAFKCHGCGLKGDAFAVLQQIEKMSFPEAKQTLLGEDTAVVKAGSEWI